MTNKKIKLPERKHTHRSAEDMLLEINKLRDENDKLKELVKSILDMLERKL
jgi:hypothetical protein